MSSDQKDFQEPQDEPETYTSAPSVTDHAQDDDES